MVLNRKCLLPLLFRWFDVTFSAQRRLPAFSILRWQREKQSPRVGSRGTGLDGLQECSLLECYVGYSNVWPALLSSHVLTVVRIFYKKWQLCCVPAKTLAHFPCPCSCLWLFIPWRVLLYFNIKPGNIIVDKWENQPFKVKLINSA